MEVFVLAFGALVIGVVLGGIIARVLSPRAAMVTALVLIGAAGISLLIGAQKQGWDGLGYTIVATILLAPLALGCGATGALAWWGLRRGGGKGAP